MADGTTSGAINKSFDNSDTGGAVKTCCKNVKGEWKERPDVFIDEVPKLLGNPQIKPTYYFDTPIPRGVSGSLKFRYKFSVRGVLVCKCMDDGRKLSETKYNEQVTADVQTWVGSMDLVSPKKLAPWMTVLTTLYEGYKIGKKIYDIYNMTPDQLKELAGEAVKKAVDKAVNSADEICKSKHKPCAEEKPAEPVPAKPGTGQPGQGDEALIS